MTRFAGVLRMVGGAGVIILLCSCRFCIAVTVHMSDEKAKGPFFQAIEKRDHRTIRAMLEKGERADAPNRSYHGMTPLHFACRYFYGNREVIELLVERGAGVNARDDNGFTPLMKTVDAWDHYEVPELELKEKLAAVHEERLAVIEYLLGKGAEVNGCNRKTDRAFGYEWSNKTGTPLHYAMWTRYVDVVKLLIAHHADVNALDSDGVSPLMIAFDRGEDLTALVATLLENGANPDVGDPSSAPLHRAMAFGSQGKEVVRLLVQHGADVNIRDRRGKTPLMMDTVAGDVAEILLAHGAQPYAGDKAGKTAPDHAVP